MFSKLLTKNPIKKEPRMLTKKVPNKKFGNNILKKFDVKYLNKAPIAPPRATYKILIKILFIDFVLLQVVFFQ